MFVLIRYSCDCYKESLKLVFLNSTTSLRAWTDYQSYDGVKLIAFVILIYHIWFIILAFYITLKFILTRLFSSPCFQISTFCHQPSPSVYCTTNLKLSQSALDDFRVQHSVFLNVQRGMMIRAKKEGQANNCHKDEFTSTSHQSFP